MKNGLYLDIYVSSLGECESYCIQILNCDHISYTISGSCWPKGSAGWTAVQAQGVTGCVYS